MTVCRCDKQAIWKICKLIWVFFLEYLRCLMPDLKCGINSFCMRREKCVGEFHSPPLAERSTQTPECRRQHNEPMFRTECCESMCFVPCVYSASPLYVGVGVRRPCWLHVVLRRSGWWDAGRTVRTGNFRGVAWRQSSVLRRAWGLARGRGSGEVS